MAGYAREVLPPALVMDYWFARLQGWDATFVRDERCTDTAGWRIEHREGGMIPSGAEKDRIMIHAQQAVAG